MGIPSISILLHEVTKLLHHAKTRDFCYLRVGTCGGLGVEPGTVVISDKAVNEKVRSRRRVGGRVGVASRVRVSLTVAARSGRQVEACDEVWSLGKCKRNPALFDPTLAEELAAQAAGHRVSSPAIAEELRARDRRRRDEGLDYMSGEGHSFSRDDGRAIPAQRGTTMAASGFYEQQGRIDGAICDHTAEEKMQWLQSLHDAGVRNIEMEVGRSHRACLLSPRSGLAPASLPSLCSGHQAGRLLPRDRHPRVHAVHRARGQAEGGPGHSQARGGAILSLAHTRIHTWSWWRWGKWLVPSPSVLCSWWPLRATRSGWFSGSSRPVAGLRSKGARLRRPSSAACPAARARARARQPLPARLRPA